MLIFPYQQNFFEELFCFREYDTINISPGRAASASLLSLPGKHYYCECDGLGHGDGEPHAYLAYHLGEKDEAGDYYHEAAEYGVDGGSCTLFHALHVADEDDVEGDYEDSEAVIG